MIGLRTQAFDLPLKHVFTISRGSVSVQQTLIVQLSAEGQHGYGEATVNDYYGATIENMTAAVERVRPLLERAQMSDWEATLAEVGQAIGGLNSHGASFALCAVDLALHDLWGKLQGASLGSLWGLDREAGPHSNFTIGIDTIPKMVQKLLEEPAWPIYKIKLGASEDIAIVQELRQHTAAPFRVDANCGWSPAEAVRLSHELKELGVEFIEQPLPSDNPEAMRQVVQDSALPLFADESCVCEADVERCGGLFHGVNIKLVKCGGLAPARRMIARARELGLLVMMGCMTESTVGISAIAQLLPLLDHVDMDGAALLAKDIASGAKVINGQCLLPSENGSGVTLLAGPLA